MLVAIAPSQKTTTQVSVLMYTQNSNHSQESSCLSTNSSAYQDYTAIKVTRLHCYQGYTAIIMIPLLSIWLSGYLSGLHIIRQYRSTHFTASSLWKNRDCTMMAQKQNHKTDSRNNLPPPTAVPSSKKFMFNVSGAIMHFWQIVLEKAKG